MTKKQLSTAAGISMTRITQLMANMTANVDYVEVRNANNDPRIEFTESGISKIMNRNTKGGRTKIERVRSGRGRPKKILLTNEKEEK